MLIIASHKSVAFVTLMLALMGNNGMYDFLIIGGGPAAVAAGVYAARKKLKTILITEEKECMLGY